MNKFITIDSSALFRVSVTQKIFFVVGLLALIQIGIFPTEISILGSPNVLKNDIFKLDAYLGRKVSLNEKLLFNFMLYLPFIIQHLIMARMWFKEAMQRSWRNYVFYERIIFNFVSSILNFIMFGLYQTDETVIFKVNFPFATEVWYTLYALGLSLWIWSIADMGENDIFAFGLIRDFEKKKGSKFPAFVDVETQSRLRASCRHPLYFAIFIFNIFGPTVYTATRLGHTITIVLFTYVGAVLEERGLKSLPGYTEYMKATPNQFIPDIRVWFRGSKNAKKD